MTKVVNMQKPAFNFKNVSYRYPGEKDWALKEINLKVPSGSFSVIVGPSGCGKSTLLLLARGFSREYGGRLKGNILIDGRDIKQQSVAELGSKIALIFQNPALQLHQLRVIDEVMSAPMYQALPYEECQRRAQELTDQLLGKSFYYRSPNELSSGEQQKTALAAALSMKAEVLLLDEPLSFLDTKADQEILEIILRFHREGKTIVLATHDIEEIAKHATHMSLIDKGKLILQGSPEKILYSKECSEILTAPLSVRTAKALVEKNNIFGQPVGWDSLIGQIKLKEVSQITKPLKGKPILRFKNISFYYSGTNKGVSEVNLEISKNEILGIVGANGSGKTTLAKILLGILKPKTGNITLNHKNITTLPTQARARKIGYVTQDPMDMFFESNIWHEAAAGPKFLGLTDPKGRARKTLENLNLWRYRAKHPDSISGGEKSLLGLADILVNEPEILLLDEPEFGLDPKSWRKVVTIVKNLKKQDKSIIVITQDLEAAIFLCDRIVLLSEGRIAETGTPKHVFADQALLKKAHLLPLPMFKMLKYVNNVDLESEEMFISAITEKLNQK